MPAPAQRDVATAVALYRDALGFTASWRDGDTTVGLALPGTPAG